MADPPHDRDAESEAETPLWVKVFGIVFVAVVLLFFILLFTRGPHRGHGEHRPPGSPSGHTPGGNHG